MAYFIIVSCECFILWYKFDDINLHFIYILARLSDES